MEYLHFELSFLDRGLPNFFCGGSDSTYYRLCGSYILCLNCSVYKFVDMVVFQKALLKKNRQWDKFDSLAIVCQPLDLLMWFRLISWKIMGALALNFVFLHELVLLFSVLIYSLSILKKVLWLRKCDSNLSIILHTFFPLYSFSSSTTCYFLLVSDLIFP